MKPHATSNRRRRFRIYLAGPISGCNDEQKRFWREHVRGRFTDIFDYIDPLEGPVDDKATPYRLVERDLRAIEQADAILAHMWRESIGTAMGLVHAKSKGKVVVVSDPNRLNNRLLHFYADVVEHDLDRALKSLRDLLRSQDGLIVMRRDGLEQPFDRVELTESLRQACRRAGMRLCCGGLFGIGETWPDRVDLALTLRDEVKPAVTTLNFLNPAPGTALEH